MSPPASKPELTTMQDHIPLVVTRCIEYAGQYHADTEVVSRTVEGPTVRTNWREIRDRARAVALTLLDLGVKCDLDGEIGWGCALQDVPFGRRVRWRRWGLCP